MFCRNCGKEIDDKAAICVHCGVVVNEGAVANTNPNAKSKLVAGLLGILLGAYGIHNFYLGYTKKAVTQLLICLLGACVAVGPLVAGIWGLVEGIQILMGKINVDAAGVPLKD